MLFVSPKTHSSFRAYPFLLFGHFPYPDQTTFPVGSVSMYHNSARLDTVFKFRYQSAVYFPVRQETQPLNHFPQKTDQFTKFASILNVRSTKNRLMPIFWNHSYNNVKDIRIVGVRSTEQTIRRYHSWRLLAPTSCKNQLRRSLCHSFLRSCQSFYSFASYFTVESAPLFKKSVVSVPIKSTAF